jgi:nucleoside-diphosphate kinase
MSIERTFSIVKPDAVNANNIGAIYERLENAGLQIIAAKMIRLSKEKAEAFYAEHSERPFFPGLVDFMISGPVIMQVLEGENAISKYRALMGATRVSEAEAGTIRGDLAGTCPHGAANAVHGSDSPESAEREIACFFEASEIHPRKELEYTVE